MNVWKRRIPAGWLLACLLSLFLVTNAVGTIFEPVQTQWLIARSGTAVSWLTIGNSATSNSYLTIGSNYGAQTPAQTNSMFIVVAFAVMATVLILLSVRQGMTVGNFVFVAIAGIMAMIFLAILTGLLGGI